MLVALFDNTSGKYTGILKGGLFKNALVGHNQLIRIRIL
jgi:hypothetical protein